MADEEAKEGDAPVEEWRFVRDITSIVDRQNPVAMFQHGVGNHRFARFSLGIEIYESEELEEAKKENLFLKKAAAFFAKEID
jgi:hypothetical protein